MGVSVDAHERKTPYHPFAIKGTGGVRKNNI